LDGRELIFSKKLNLHQEGGPVLRDASWEQSQASLKLRNAQNREWGFAACVLTAKTGV